MNDDMTLCHVIIHTGVNVGQYDKEDPKLSVTPCIAFCCSTAVSSGGKKKIPR